MWCRGKYRTGKLIVGEHWITKVMCGTMSSSIQCFSCYRGMAGIFFLLSLWWCWYGYSWGTMCIPGWIFDRNRWKCRTLVGWRVSRMCLHVCMCVCVWCVCDTPEAPCVPSLFKYNCRSNLVEELLLIINPIMRKVHVAPLIFEWIQFSKRT